jgi:GTP-sensing pleiotropic transcriptional regulator CodY
MQTVKKNLVLSVIVDCININTCTINTRAVLLGSGLNEQGTGENYMTSNFILRTLRLISLKSRIIKWNEYLTRAMTNKQTQHFYAIKRVTAD